MAENSKIEWCDHTVNLWWGCTEVHEGCDNCYARTFSHRYDNGNSLWGNDVPRRMINSAFSNLAKFQRKAKDANEIHRVFIGSMMDIFEKSMPLLNPLDHITETDDLRQELFTQIDFELYDYLMMLFLTKRPSNINKMIPAGWSYEPGMMFGTSPVNQQTFDTLVRQLLEVPAKRFLSIEPQLGPIKLGKLEGIDWIIQGGESGHGRRPFNLDWARSMRDECASLGIPYFFKQIDKVQPIPEDLEVRQFPKI